MEKVLLLMMLLAKGQLTTINLANELIKERTHKMAKATKKQALGRGLSALLKETSECYNLQVR